MMNEMSGWKPVEIKKLRTVSILDRRSKVSVEHFGKAWEPGRRFADFLSFLPDVLAARDLKDVVSSVATACKTGSMVVLGMGAHPIKVGLSPIVIDLMSRGIIKGVALNGAGIIHDFELAYAGKTSEIVEDVICDGSFGMTEETAVFLNAAITKGYEEGIGIGQSVGREILSSSFPYKDLSILAAGARLDIPVTVHVAIGTDIIHMHPEANGAAIGDCSLRDFRIFSRLISRLQDGVYINLGSAVVMPEVFLKAVSLVRNLGFKLESFTTVNMDFKKHYRPQVNVVNRPPGTKGKGYNIIGHHEIMFPLLAALVIEELENEN